MKCVQGALCCPCCQTPPTNTLAAQAAVETWEGKTVITPPALATLGHLLTG